MPHIHKQYDFTVSVFIVHKNEVLLVHHPKYNKWLPMGGHIELDETPDEALFREIEEETGLSVEILNTKPDLETDDTEFMYSPSYIDVHQAGDGHKHIGMVYFARATNKNHRLSDEHLDIHWLSREDLDKKEYNLTDSVKMYCHEALKKAKN